MWILLRVKSSTISVYCTAVAAVMSVMANFDQVIGGDAPKPTDRQILALAPDTAWLIF
jgi:hypothetical protein